MLRIQLLGPVAALDDGAQLHIGGPKQRTVLAVLTIDPGAVVSVDRLIEAVWGDEVPNRAPRSISTYVSNLRRVLGDAIARNGNGYEARLSRDHVDATDFEDRIRAAQQRIRTEPAEGASAIREALELWSGEPFQGVDGHHVLEPHISRLNELRFEGLEAAIGAEIETGVCDLVELDRLVAEHPERERVRGLQMRGLYRGGRQQESLASYKAFRDRLAHDLGIDPSPELQELELRILQQDPELSTRTPQARPDFDESLPARYSSFLGRNDEVAEIVAAVADSRLVTVVGPGGIGKSSLVVEAARGTDVHQGARIVRVVVDTLGERDPVDALTDALGLDPTPGVDPVQVIAGYLASHRHLLILDGCEPHLDTVAPIVDRLLSSRQQTRVLITSREPLGLAGEAIIRVGGLDATTAEQLFVDRAELRSADERTLAKVGELCSVLEGMPLAIELAAARARSVSVERLAERIDDLIPLLKRSRPSGERHDSIAAAMNWSYELLDVPEQRALRWLSVFPGGFDHRDAEALLDDPYAEDAVARLVDVSLVQPPDETGRHRILEPVRQYARSLLERDGEHEHVVERYAHWIADEARRAGVELWSPNTRSAGAWIHNHYPELRAVMDWAIKHDEPDIAVRILAAIGHRVTMEGDADPLLDNAVNAVRHPAASQTGELAIAAAHIVIMLWKAGRSREAQEIMERAEDIVEASEDPVARAEVMQRRAVIELDSSWVHPSSIDQLDAAIDQLRDAGVAHANRYLWNRAIFLLRLGRFDEAMETMAERDAWWIATMGVPDPDALQLQGEIQRLSGNRRGCVECHSRAAHLYRAESAFESERLIWQYVTQEAIALGDRDLYATAIEAGRRAREKTGGEADLWIRVRVASYEQRHTEVLSLSRQWADGTLEVARRDGTRHLDESLYSATWRESPFFVLLLPIAAALEALGRDEDAHRIAREAPGLMAQDRYPHTGPAGEAELWAELLERLGGGEPAGLTLEEGFNLVHEILSSRSPETE
ncbi:MAG: BTAD domain-containing putative transcriptional regulator [Acidimicrobiia bacterium]|nr:BTAD domain-containing putative transcriptional regulator [Acidimicrobiia bacterium]